MPRQRAQQRSGTTKRPANRRGQPPRTPTPPQVPKVMTAGWERELDRWLADFLELLGDARRRPWGEAYVRGLLSRSERKSFAVMAEHVAATDPAAAAAQSHHLQHFVTNST